MAILDETHAQINGLNLYMYCNDNPVMIVDHSGYLAFFILTAIMGAAIGFGITTVVDYFDDGRPFNGSVSWGWYVGAIAIGSVIGAGIGIGISYYATGSITSSCGQLWNGLLGQSTFYRTMSQQTMIH